MTNNKLVGSSAKRIEDFRFLTGQGRYLDDMQFPGMCHVTFLRSTHAHGRIQSINTEKARKMPGVVAIFTAEDLKDKGGIPCGWLVKGKNDEPMREPKHPILAEDYVRHVGEPVVAVVAKTKHQAKDAVEVVDLQIDVLPAVADVAKTLNADAPKVFADMPDNLCFDWEIGVESEVDTIFADAPQVIEHEMTNNRLVPNALEPRSAISIFEQATGQYTLYTTSQNPHVIRLLMGAFVLNIPEHKLRVVSPDVGGGFGSKIYHYAEEAFMTWASEKVGCPLKWTSDRSEAFISDAHARDHHTKIKLAFDNEGTFLGLKVETTANLGAYLSTFAPSIPTYLYATLLAGQYKTPAIYASVKGVFTHTVPVDAYRGAGRPEATTLLETMVDRTAVALGMDPVAIRRKNMIQKDEFPYQTPVALEYDTGDFIPLLDRAIGLSNYGSFEARRKESAARGKLRGIGISSYIEACGLAPSSLAGALGARAGLYEAATIRVNPTGSVSVLTGSHSHGQGHETTFAQIVSDRLGISLDSIDIVHGDTAAIPFGMGTYGSRSMAVGGSAIAKAVDKIIDKGKKIAAHLMEVADSDVVFNDGTFSVKGSDKTIGFGDVALTAYVPHNFPHDSLEPGLEENAFYDPKNFTFPSGTYICEIEVDPATGSTDVVAFTAVDDFGNVINPMIVEGQVHGGLVQGLGQALLEHCVYDDSGQLLSASFMDYTMPRADDMPSFSVDQSQLTPCTHNPLGAKGCGEAGAIGSPAAVVNAMLNALAPIGVTSIDMPLSPYRVWQAIENAKT